MQIKKDKDGNIFTVKNSYMQGTAKFYNVVRVKDGKTISIRESVYSSRDFSFDEIKEISKNTTSPKSTNSVLIGLDLSSTNSGIAIFIDKQYVYSTVIKPSGGTYKRINYVVEELLKIIKQYDVKHAIIEDIFLKKGATHTFKVLSGLQHCVCCMLIKNNVSFDILSAETWRKHAGISNKSRDIAKNNSIKETIKKYGVNQEDESEAINIVQGFINMKGG